jgi:hypothetical protein
MKHCVGVLCEGRNTASKLDHGVSVLIATQNSQESKFSFDNLAQIKDKFKATKLPPFPSSSVWKNHVSVVEKRKVELTDYLNMLSRQVDLLKDDELSQFFGIKGKFDQNLCFPQT